MRLPLIVSSLFALATLTVHAGQGAKSLTKRFDRLDLNDDAVLDANEFTRLLPAKLSKNNALARTQAEMFAWFDEDSSASLDLGEWLEAMSASESPDFSAAVDELDTNDDGKLTWKEFNRVIHCYVSSKTSRKWFNALSGESSTVSKNRGVAFNLTSQNAKRTEPGDMISVTVAPLGEPGEFVMTNGGDCFGPISSTPEDSSNPE
jgi:Ca2+-binding EF-hand superfamily protein